MADDQEALRKEYGRLLKERVVFREMINTAAATWDGKGQKPNALLEAEAKRDTIDIELARIADKARF
jgi:hypothetical protein